MYRLFIQKASPVGQELFYELYYCVDGYGPCPCFIELTRKQIDEERKFRG